jgi:hypothetical protein
VHDLEPVEPEPPLQGKAGLLGHDQHVEGPKIINIIR